MYNQIVFMTGNRTKLAHLRHIGQNLSIPVNLFHELTYHASYNEPRIYNREQLLKDSVESALEQIKKSGLSTSNKLFLIEDTSVIIDALSTPSKEVPGLDVKYWMKDKDFSTLDQTLKSAGNNRKVTVRSDMILFSANRTIFKQFTGFSSGNITDTEFSIETHLLYPWLDSKTFNKWFIPDNKIKPISLLPIHEADEADFRKKAFEQLITYIHENNLTPVLKYQPPLFTSRKLLIIVGYSCAGKTTIAQNLALQNRVRHIEASDFMRVAFNEVHSTDSSINIEEFASTALQLKPEIVAEKIVKELAEFKHQTDSIITGFRSPHEAQFIKDNLSEVYDINIVKVDADFETRYKRALRRNRQNDAIENKHTFKNKDRSQMSMGIEEFNAHTISNIGTLNHFFKKMDKLKLINSPQEEVSIRIGELKISAMLFLKQHYDVNGQGQYFTTTELSKNITHHKDNISRSFNQYFSPDFENKVENGVIKYRLSNSGYSKICLFEIYNLE